jgi:hypothetical protein
MLHVDALKIITPLLLLLGAGTAEGATAIGIVEGVDGTTIGVLKGVMQKICAEGDTGGRARARVWLQTQCIQLPKALFLDLKSSRFR